MSKFSVAFDLATKVSAERALSLSPLIWKIKRMLNIGTERKLKKVITMVSALASKVIKQKQKMGFSTHQDLLSRFMCTVDYDEKYLRDIVVSFLLAGRDTVASSLTSFFWLMSQNPKVEAVILNESTSIMGHSQELANFKQLRQMPYLQASSYEFLRLFPPVQFDSKFAREDDILPDGTFVRKGTRVTYHAYAMGRMEDLRGPDYLEFKPERRLKNGLFMPESPF
ncbi:hypothetical protein GIB67_023186 [Kingdonia uniflora]|uniref:Cytochrome P450 n=1 Tax=Kingdonia uniflora TaxID=39325 RepID=A0A7J7MCC9_9MAGN|nr:hypothetical protein GIB67_023186 [Kingdonia uniflora]